jgi:small subunit ribosomal protein S21
VFTEWLEEGISCWIEEALDAITKDYWTRLFRHISRVLFAGWLFQIKEVISLATVILRPNESQDQLLKRFRKKVVKSGVLSTVRRKRWFISKSELRRIEKKKAIRRLKRRMVGRVYEGWSVTAGLSGRFAWLSSGIKEVFWWPKKKGRFR